MEHSYPILQSVRNRGDLRKIEDDPLSRYDVPKYWLELELLGLTAIFESHDAAADAESYAYAAAVSPVLSKRTLTYENIVSRALPLFMRL